MLIQSWGGLHSVKIMLNKNKNSEHYSTGDTESIVRWQKEGSECKIATSSLRQTRVKYFESNINIDFDSVTNSSGGVCFEKGLPVGISTWKKTVFRVYFVCRFRFFCQFSASDSVVPPFFRFLRTSRSTVAMTIFSVQCHSTF